jgi:hypothetical protein
VYCERCDVAVHQACYGIAAVPEGDWLCDPCREHEEALRAQGRSETEIRPPGHQQRGDLLEGGAHACRCVLCPIKYGAFKRSEDGRHWVHSVSLSGRVGRCWRAVHAALVGPVVAKLVPPRLLRHILSAGSQRTRVVKMHALDYQPQPHTSPSSPPQACALWVPETFLGTREVPGVGRQDYVGGLERVRQER